ncbi:1-acyl-sn-glycerol-3-phosphate acyltransferase [Acidocella sp.]|uniref:lysophospholipid acyltransferase family protein n=1 Tax=Acidocella sp. TaxID=50710 RepID=UPI00260CD07D|nr:lysophospholipid acyltransferase family protein [Acidocella sp.]
MLLRVLAILVWTLFCMPVQALLLMLPGRGKVGFAQVYWRGVALVLGLRLRVVGEISAHRPSLFIANHCSWLDIVALGSVLPGCFVAKGEVGRWPVISWIARLGRTVFVSRNRANVAREQGALAARLNAGDGIILFPEGTSSDGNRILPFASSFFVLADAAAKPYVQPVTLVYDGLDGLPVVRADRPEIAWYGDMELAPHFNRIARRRSLHATIVLDAPIAPGTFPNRKIFAAALEARIAHNAAALRQGRSEA